MAPWKNYLENSMARRVTQQLQRAIVRPSLSRVGPARRCWSTIEGRAVGGTVGRWWQQRGGRHDAAAKLGVMCYLGVWVGRSSELVGYT
jgi:hypothetical protein